MSVGLKKATQADVPKLKLLEQRVVSRTYYPMLDAHEWEEKIANGNAYFIDKNGAIAGSLSYEKHGNRIYISSLVVDPEFQNQGIGKEAMEHVLKELAAYPRIDLITHPDNDIAVHLYQSLGFVIESRKENYYGDGEPRLVLALNK